MPPLLAVITMKTVISVQYVVTILYANEAAVISRDMTNNGIKMS